MIFCALFAPGLSITPITPHPAGAPAPDPGWGAAPDPAGLPPWTPRWRMGVLVLCTSKKGKNNQNACWLALPVAGAPTVRYRLSSRLFSVVSPVRLYDRHTASYGTALSRLPEN